VNVMSGGSGFEFRAIWQLVLRRRWVILAATFVFFGAVALHTLRQPKVYGATTSIVIDAAAPRVLDNQVQDVSEPSSGSYWVTREYTETQINIITSRTTLRSSVSTASPTRRSATR